MPSKISLGNRVIALLLMLTMFSAMVTADDALDAVDPTPVHQDSTPSNPRPPVQQMTGCRTQGQIAVTYSEGPSDATAKIVRQLNQANAKATFFVNTTWLYQQQYAMVVQNTYNAGHFIGMTYRVKNDDSSKLTDAELKDDIIRNSKMLESLINVAPKYVRLHMTQPEDTRTEHILQELGFVLVGYNLDSQDYQRDKPIHAVYKSAFDNYKSTYDAKGSFISIQYDIPDTNSLPAVPRMINTISEEGYTMVRLDGCLNDPKPYKKSSTSKEYVSDKFSFNTTGYHEGQNIIPMNDVDQYEKQYKGSTDADDDMKKKSAASANSFCVALLGVCLGVSTFVARHFV